MGVMRESRDKIQPIGRSWNPRGWTGHGLALIASRVHDVDVLEEKLAPSGLELNTHVAQALEADPREVGAECCHREEHTD